MTGILGKQVTYSPEYDPTILYSIPRLLQREKLNFDGCVSFTGVDIWNCYEFSYLNKYGKPEVLILEIYIDALSTNIVESKSMKLYLGSFQNSKFDTITEVVNILERDLIQVVEGKVQIGYKNLDEDFLIQRPAAKLIDNLDIECTEYEVNSNLLAKLDEEIVSESLYSNLLKSNCLVTGQPDWGSIIIEYHGFKIVESSLLKYLVSYRNHSEFHEHCIERIYCDIMDKCQSSKLTVYGRYTRRGGIDINPYRTNMKSNILNNVRLARQ
jgi:7-cyano-7-deazaguanine reductase